PPSSPLFPYTTLFRSFMPGVPREMKKMFEEQVLPKIGPMAPKNSTQVRLRTFGLPESVVGERLDGIESQLPGVTIGYRAHFPERSEEHTSELQSPYDL